MSLNLIANPVETARDKAANDVTKEFAEAYDDMMKTTDRMSGFFVCTFDDEGNLAGRLHMGSYFPIPPPMLPEIIKQAVIEEVY